MFFDASKFFFAFDETIIFVHLSSTWLSSIESGSSCSSIQRPVSSFISAVNMMGLIYIPISISTPPALNFNQASLTPPFPQYQLTNPTLLNALKGRASRVRVRCGVGCEMIAWKLGEMRKRKIWGRRDGRWETDVTPLSRHAPPVRPSPSISQLGCA